MTLRRIETLVVLVAACTFASLAGDAWVVRMDGVGPVKIGMSLPELNTVLHEKFSMPDDKEDQGCFNVEPKRHPHISFMIVDGRLARVDVYGPGVPTVAGIQVGDSETRALEVYGSAMKVEPSAYTGPEDHYLTVRSSNGRYGVRFETEKGKIETFYAGRFETIQYVEGCS